MGVFGRIRDFFYAPQLAVAGDVSSAPTQPAGSDGIAAYSGWIPSSELSPKLQGQQKWVTYANAANMAIIATGLRYFGNLLAGTEWHCEPNAAGGAGADRGVEIVRAGLLDALMPKAWPMVV